MLDSGFAQLIINAMPPTFESGALHWNVWAQKAQPSSPSSSSLLLLPWPAEPQHSTSNASTHLAPTFDFEVHSQGAVQEILLIAQLLAFESGDGFQSWVDSRPPEELCELYLTGMIDDTMLPGGRATDPCQGVDDPSRYIPK